MQAPIKAVAFALCFPTFAVACNLQPLLVSGQSVHAGPISVSLGEADDLHHPSAW